MSALLWNRAAVDFAVLPAALVSLQKQHSRIVHDHDSLVAQYIAMALGVVERRANINLVPATFESVGVNLAHALAVPCCYCAQFAAWGYLLPFNNAREVRLFDAAAVEITSAWSVVQEQFGANRDAYLVGDSQTLPAGVASAELDVGVETVDELDPAVLAVVLRLAASLYENREANVPLTDAVFAGSRFDGEITSIWRPTA